LFPTANPILSPEIEKFLEKEKNSIPTSFAHGVLIKQGDEPSL